MTTEWNIVLPGYDRPPLSLNQRLHWAKENRIKQQLSSDTLWMARAAKLPRGLCKATFELHWWPGMVRRRDTMNMMSTLKVITDALVLYGVTADDDSETVREVCFIHEVQRLGRLMVKVIDTSLQDAA